MFQTLLHDSFLGLPFLAWAISGLVVLFVQIITQCGRASFWASVVMLALQLAYSIKVFDPSVSEALFFGSVMLDPLSQILNILAVCCVFCVVLMSAPGMFESTKTYTSAFSQFPEYLIALLFSGFGASVAISAVDLTSFFLGIETLSIALYSLCGFFRTDLRSTESALKYLFVGGFATVLLLYGIAFIYGAAGTTNFLEISKVIVVGNESLVILGSIFTLVGLGFKLALVPFHFYTPDVYEGAPTPISGYLASIVKLAVVGAGLRMFWGVLDSVAEYWEPFWMSLCILSILIGNVAALQQKTVKKLLAFSSISHAGFLGLGLLLASPGSGDMFPVLSYLLVYIAMTMGIFALVAWMEKRDQVFYLEDLRGLGSKRVGVGILFSIFSLSLAGLPPFAGFMVKFWIFQALVEQGYWIVAILAVLGSIIGLGYYLRIMMLIFMAKEGEEGAAVSWAGMSDRYYSLRLVILAAVLISLLGGIKPDFYADWILQTIALN